ncbi:type 12 methyltransferase [Halovivax asiaticus JCM 14624]|uniref:Type 12 methyltransferase n=1 Tax=Halovivax asiaticus JCM 14624 TaxID=1227490 RepID=M0BNZ2_9EURY|nr:class I SAM-dependent methyltransferase [Halovivax asiaticus]ELZ12606.1 type 12 methyltransferase [Halovivax asiaticus JCM 14624]
MTDRREAVRQNALYLQHVRPIDPEEIAEYVEGQAHPAVVRQLLREEAPDLGLIERDDGTFVPVSDEPVPQRTDAIREFPPRYVRRLDDWLAERYGPNWHEGASGDLLRSTLRRTKAQYLEGGPVTYDEDVAASYAIYHLPGYYAAIQYALDDLAERGLFERHLRVLDVGAGVGGPALGLFDYLPDDALIEYHAVEPSAAADVLDAMLEETGRNVHATVHRTTAEDFEPTDGTDDGTYDLVLACNVLSELDEPVAVARRYIDALAEDGSLLAMAPADRETAIGLREIERALEDGSSGGRADDIDADEHRSVTVYGPMVRLWPGEHPTDRGWSFDVRPDLAVPSVQSRLDDAADDPDHAPGEFENVDVQFAYSILRTDGTRHTDVSLDTGQWAKMAEMDRHVSNRIDLVAAKVSRSLSEGGALSEENATQRGGQADDPNPLFKITDGSESRDHYAVVTKETALNRPLIEADYGDLLAFESVLALWNDDEAAYNLVVDEETIVDPLA